MTDSPQTFDGEVHAPPPLSEEHLRRIPARRGVALLLAEADKPIQLLTAADMRARIRNRIRSDQQDASRKMPDLTRVACKIAWKLAQGHFETDLYFLELARRLWPDEYRDMVAWKPGWFVHVDPGARAPRFVRTRRVFAEAGRYLGPFPDGRSADAFIDALRDGFYLCRNWTTLRQAPHGESCPYAQMGRCLGACHGRISMDAYRQVVARAADFAAGRREDYRSELRRRMREASEKLAFEEAASYKARLDRLAELGGPAYRYVAPAERFRFVLVQPWTARRAKVFLADRGAVTEGDPLRYPPPAEDARRVLEQMRAHVGAGEAFDEAARWRMGLLCRQLFSSPRRKGLMRRWHEGLDAEELGAAIRDAADAIGLKPPGAAPPSEGKENTSRG